SESPAGSMIATVAASWLATYSSGTAGIVAMAAAGAAEPEPLPAAEPEPLPAAQAARVAASARAGRVERIGYSPSDGHGRRKPIGPRRPRSFSVNRNQGVS